MAGKPTSEKLKEKVQALEKELAHHRIRTEGKTVYKELTKLKKELVEKNGAIEELNKIVEVLLRQPQEERKAVQEDVLSNINQLILPYLLRLRSDRARPIADTLLDILESNLNDITSPFVKQLSSELAMLSPMEIKVANL